MRVIGIGLWAVGLLLFMYAALVFDPSIQAYSSYAPDRVVNLGRQQQQMLLAMAGLTLFLAGAVLQALSYFLPAEGAEKRTPAPLPRRGVDQKSAESFFDAERMAQQRVRPGDDGAQV
jgi:hypothetical protein